MNRLNMIVTDLLPETGGPNYTFNRNNCYSYVDHCAVSNDIIGLVHYTTVMPESVLNSSDHLAIKGLLKLVWVVCLKSIFSITICHTDIFKLLW